MFRSKPNSMFEGTYMFNWTSHRWGYIIRLRFLDDEWNSNFTQTRLKFNQIQMKFMANYRWYFSCIGAGLNSSPVISSFTVMEKKQITKIIPVNSSVSSFVIWYVVCYCYTEMEHLGSWEHLQWKLPIEKAGVLRVSHWHRRLEGERHPNYSKRLVPFQDFLERGKRSHHACT
jgi:hypothetical protein